MYGNLHLVKNTTSHTWTSSIPRGHVEGAAGVAGVVAIRRHLLAGAESFAEKTELQLVN